MLTNVLIAVHAQMFVQQVQFLLINLQKKTITIGYTGTFETRRGGYMPAITQKNSVQYYSENKSVRNGLDAEWENRINSKTKLNIKGNGTFFNRNISTNVFGMKARQLFWFTEASLLRKEKYHDVVMGVNFSGDLFKKELPDSSQINNYNFQTIGFFLQDEIEGGEDGEEGADVEQNDNHGHLSVSSGMVNVKARFIKRL